MSLLLFFKADDISVMEFLSLMTGALFGNGQFAVTSNKLAQTLESSFYNMRFSLSLVSRRV